MSDNLYELLGVTKTASQAEIKAAYRRLAMEHHPDRGGNADVFVKIQEAYDILSDEEARKEYDTTGRKPQDKAQQENSLQNDAVSIFGEVLNSIEEPWKYDLVKVMVDNIGRKQSIIQQNLRTLKRQISKLEKTQGA